MHIGADSNAHKRAQRTWRKGTKNTGGYYQQVKIDSVFAVVRKREEGFNHRGHGEHRRRGMLRVAAGILTENNLCVLCVLCGEKEKRELTTENADSTEKVGKLRVAAAILAGNSLCVLCILHGAG